MSSSRRDFVKKGAFAGYLGTWLSSPRQFSSALKSKKNMLRNIIVTLFIIAMFTTASSTANAQKKDGATALRHVVLFKFKDTSKPEDIKRVEEAFAGLADKIKLIKDFEWGTNNSPENLNQGLTHCFFVTFSSDKDRDEYLVHPDHKAFVEVLKPHLDKVTVIDYWTK